MIRSHDSITSPSIRKLNLPMQAIRLRYLSSCDFLLNENNGAVVGRKIKLSVI